MFSHHEARNDEQDIKRKTEGKHNEIKVIVRSSEGNVII